MAEFEDDAYVPTGHEDIQKARGRIVAGKERFDREKKALHFVQRYTGVRKKEPLRGELWQLQSGFWKTTQIMRYLELDEHTGTLVVWNQRPPESLVYKIEELQPKATWSLCGGSNLDKAFPISVLDMKDLHDVDASKPYLSIFVHFRGKGLILIAESEEDFEIWLNALGQFVGVSSSSFKWKQGDQE
eukprot:symbB.v1.2.032996.t1/scaffold4036.1/size45792/2